MTPDDVQIEILCPNQVFGSTTFCISVRVRNISSEELCGVEVEPIALPGRVKRLSKDENEPPLSEIELTKRRLVKEMERQIEHAYERGRKRQLFHRDKLRYYINEVLQVYAGFLPIKRRDLTMVPSWASEAFRIHEWADVERLEKDVMSLESDNNLLKVAFLINKDKLQRLLPKPAPFGNEGKKDVTLETGDYLQSGASLLYPFTISAPHTLRMQESDLQFRLSFRKGTAPKIIQQSVGRSLTIYASELAIPLGSLVGAGSGYAIRCGLRSAVAPANVFGWGSFGGSILLGLVFALLLSKKADAKKPITVEDFVGGFLIGAFSGLFSDEALKRLGTFFQ
ncbi:MAG: hypothetical protein JWQ04_216 [Pedosphaera sp.]|nr:hypothetical protein [Pedosphaera sp.]